MKRIASILSVFLSIPILVAAQEHDDLYFTPSDREEAIANYQASAKVYSQNQISDAATPSYEKVDDRIYNTTQGRTVNPEYVAQYRSRAEARSQQDEEVYFDEDFESEASYTSQQPVINNYYYGSSWGNPFYDVYDPYYSDYWRWRNDWRWRRAAFYDPFYDPFWSPGWSISVSIGWNSWGRWGHHHHYRPYYSSWGYGGYYDPYWYGGGYSPVYYQNIYIVDNENSNRIRRGRAVSRGSVVSDTRGRINDGPVTRSSSSRSVISSDRNSRTSSATNGRVINTSSVSTRSAASRDFSRNSGTDGGVERNTSIRSRMDYNNNNIINRSGSSRTSTNRSEPVRSYERPDNSRSSDIYRSSTPQRSREYVPQRNQNNNRSISVPRSNGSNSRSSGYSQPQRSNSSYNRSSSGSSSRSSSVGTSRSSSSRSSGSTPSRSSSSRRGGN